MTNKKNQDPIFISLVLLIAILFVLTLISTALTQAGGSVDGGPITPSNRTSTNTELSPASWTFAIWGPIYLWQAFWIVYVIVCIFRRNEQGPLYRNPPVLNYVFLSAYALNLAISIGWLFAFAANQQIWSLLCLIGLQVTLYIVMISYYSGIKKYCKDLAHTHRWDLLCLRILVQNGVALYASWCTVATLVGFTIVLIYISKLTEEAACCFSLSILSLELILFFIFDVTVFDRYTRYTFTTYPTLIWALVGILVRNFKSDRPHMIFALSLLTIVFAMFIIKLVVAIRRRKSDPLDHEMPEKRVLNPPVV